MLNKNGVPKIIDIGFSKIKYSNETSYRVKAVGKVYVTAEKL